MRTRAAIAVLALLGGLTLLAEPSSATAAGTYEVTITNLTSGQPFTPALVATHKGSDGFFRVGDSASTGLERIAESGDLDPMITRISDDRDFFDHVVKVGDPELPPVMPGQSITLAIDAASPHNFLSWASMLICTNDGFTGVDTLKLPSVVGRSITVSTDGYDAGTEHDTEEWKDIVPPCAPLTDQDNMGQSTAGDQPGLAEGGVIQHHPGILGVGDLDPTTNDWTNPVATLTVKRIA